MKNHRNLRLHTKGYKPAKIADFYDFLKTQGA